MATNKIKSGVSYDILAVPEIQLLFKSLSSEGAEVFLVGGCVRDSVLGLPSSDFDLATNALPSEVLKLCKKFRFKTVKTGVSHGTVSVVFAESLFHVTTFRSDLVTDGRHAKVKFSKSYLEDCKRRDFTINAMYMTVEGQILDPLGGRRDLISGKVRFIGKPNDRIKEDYLRILRYFRFVAYYGFAMSYIQPNVRSAFVENVDGLKSLSKERIWSEIKKLLQADNPLFALEAMSLCGVLEVVIPKAEIRDLITLLGFEKRFHLQADALNRLVSLTRDTVASLILDWPMSKRDRDQVKMILKVSRDNSSLRVKSYKYGKELTLRSLLIFQDDLCERKETEIISEIDFGCSKKFPLTSKDFIVYEEPSKQLGDLIRKIKTIWLESNMSLTKKELLARLKVMKTS
ncbi:MAG: CCA tRNA nucleotidyltransferase [Pseudomonadota bacterium]|nr:CCA tRNA nucleotidyltransferase [Pseudomonadota bacterium]